MSEAISIEIVGRDKLERALTSRPGVLQKAIRRALGLSAATVLRRAVLNVSGKVLKVDTGRLRQSLGFEVDSEGRQATVGTNVVYARRHEYGFRGPEVVRAHDRRITHAFGKRIRGTSKGARHGGAVIAHVRGHIRIADTPERPFMRPALQESKSDIERHFSDILKAALKEPA